MNAIVRPVTYYRKNEERINVVSHAAGTLLATAGITWLLFLAYQESDEWALVSIGIYGLSLIALYLASTTYHMAYKKSLRRILNKLDHGAIYLLIAGTYTPFCLIAMRDTAGWYLFGLIWSLTIAGFIFKWQYAGRFDRLSTGLYVLMGWLVIFTFRQLMDAVSGFALTFLILGGVSYSIGAVFYLLRKLPYQHAIFHLWVMAGSVLHFIAIFGLIR